MSRAFVKEEDPDAPVTVAERPVSNHPNYVTAAGLADIQSRIEALRQELKDASAGQDIASRTRVAEVQRDLRYFQVRLDSAEVIEPTDNLRVRFGHRVQFEDQNGRAYCFHVVGEDEADPSAGKVFYASPVARALIGREVGDTTNWQRGDKLVEIEILSIS